jgi:hypothetical protein
MKDSKTMNILISEFNTALNSLKSKKKKIPRIKYIPAELLQNSSQIIKYALYDHTRDIYEKGEILGDYFNTITVTNPPPPKKKKMIFMSPIQKIELTQAWIKYPYKNY